MAMLRSPDLKLRIALRVVVLAAACFVAAAACLLVARDTGARRHAAWIAALAAREVALQAQQSRWITHPPDAAPGLQGIAQLVAAPGLCIAWRDPGDGVVQRFCGGAQPATAPALFAALYRAAFAPGRAVTHPVRIGDETRGEIAVTFDPATVIAQAWRELGPVLAVMAATLAVLCALVYAALARVLRPTRTIRAGLERLAADDLSTRLPRFDLAELSAIGEVFNRLAARLDATLAERNALMRRLVALQDEERRHLARELHDEFGQCLAAIAALTASIRQTAVQDCPALVPECDRIGAIAARMMAGVRGVLLRLRPPELDELGLAASLDGLVAGWNGSGGTTRFSIAIEGACDALPAAVSAGLYRIAQEAITNAVRHAAASNVIVRLAADAESVRLSVADDGTRAEPGLVPRPGLGLLGIRERAAALGGHVSLRPREPAGTELCVAIPLALAAPAA